jgi:hypothetical protein
MLGMLAVLPIWWPGPSHALRLRLGALPGCIALGGFFVAALTRPLYSGAFGEPGGVPPVAGMDANLVAFAPMLLIQLAGLALVLLPRRPLKAT